MLGLMEALEMLYPGNPANGEPGLLCARFCPH